MIRVAYVVILIAPQDSQISFLVANSMACVNNVLAFRRVQVEDIDICTTNESRRCVWIEGGYIQRKAPWHRKKFAFFRKDRPAGFNRDDDKVLV